MQAKLKGLYKTVQGDIPGKQVEENSQTLSIPLTHKYNDCLARTESPLVWKRDRDSYGIPLILIIGPRYTLERRRTNAF